MKLLGIDYGLKRIGVAISDDLQMMAFPYCTLEGKNAVDELLKIIASEKPAKIIVGLPKNLDNTLNPIEKNIGELIRLIGQKFPGISVERVDERFTSSLALQTMIAMNTKKSDRRKKENLDKISAAIILQSYIDANKNLKK